MSEFRFSLASLLLFVLLAGAVFGIWRYDPSAGVGAAKLVTIFALSCASVAAFSRRPATRRTWLPFAVFGWAYFSVAMGYCGENFPGELLADLIELEPRSRGVQTEWYRQTIECGLCLLFGFVGAAMCNLYWKLHPPDVGGTRTDNP